MYIFVFPAIKYISFFKQVSLTLIVCTVLNEEGGVLELTKHGVRLEIPCGALREECQVQMTVILPSEIQMDHSLDSNSSGIIELLPSNLQLLKPAALTYPHCLVLKKGFERKAKIQSSDHAAGNVDQTAYKSNGLILFLIPC